MHKGNIWDNTAGSAFCFIYLHAVRILPFKRAVVCWIVVTQRKQMNLAVRAEISRASQACIKRWSVGMIDAFKIKQAWAYKISTCSLDMHTANVPLLLLEKNTHERIWSENYSIRVFVHSLFKKKALQTLICDWLQNNFVLTGGSN